MPAIAPDATRVPYKFKGKSVAVPAHYAVGHTMDENDTKFANRQLASTLGNVLVSAFHRLVDKKEKENAALADTDTAKQKNPDGTPKLYTLDDVTDAEAQAMFDTIYSNYEIGVNNNNRGDGSAVHDPATAIANNIAWERVKALLKARNIKVGSVKADKKAALVADMQRRDPSIMELAKSQVSAATPTEGLDDLFAGMETAPVPEGASTEAGPASDTSTVQGGAGTDTVSGPDSVPAPVGAETVSGSEGNDSVSAPSAGSDSVTGPDTSTGPGGGADAHGGMTSSAPAPDAGVPPSEPSSTAEIGGVTAPEAGATPANPGTLASPQPEEGTGQGPTDEAAAQAEPPKPGGAFA